MLALVPGASGSIVNRSSDPFVGNLRSFFLGVGTRSRFRSRGLGGAKDCVFECAYSECWCRGLWGIQVHWRGRIDIYTELLVGLSTKPRELLCTTRYGFIWPRAGNPIEHLCDRVVDEIAYEASTTYALALGMLCAQRRRHVDVLFSVWLHVYSRRSGCNRLKIRSAR